MRILLVRLRQIGDVVFTTPAIHALRRRFPDAHLAYIVEPVAAPVVLHNPHLNDVIVAPRARGLRGVIADVGLGRRLEAARYDIAIDFHGGPRASLLTWLSGAPTRIGYEIVGRSWMYTRRIARPRELRRRHSVENQWDLLAALGIAPPERSTDPVEMPADAVVAAAIEDRLARGGVRPGDQIVVLHVSAGNPFRRWPIEHFVSLVGRLASGEPRRRIIVTSGPSEEFSLSELRALLDRAALFVGGDSGPLHIAATTTVPIVGLYGPTLPARSAPWRSAAHPTESVDVGILSCRPCNQRVCEPGDFRCLTRIQPEHVYEACLRAVRGSGGI